jgi:hypothetical protein
MSKIFYSVALGMKPAMESAANRHRLAGFDTERMAAPNAELKQKDCGNIFY